MDDLTFNLGVDYWLTVFFNNPTAVVPFEARKELASSLVDELNNPKIAGDLGEKVNQAIGDSFVGLDGVKTNLIDSDCLSHKAARYGKMKQGMPEFEDSIIIPIVTNHETNFYMMIRIYPHTQTRKGRDNACQMSIITLYNGVISGKDSFHFYEAAKKYSPQVVELFVQQYAKSFNNFSRHDGRIKSQRLRMKPKLHLEKYGMHTDSEDGTQFVESFTKFNNPQDVPDNMFKKHFTALLQEISGTTLENCDKMNIYFVNARMKGVHLSPKNNDQNYLIGQSNNPPFHYFQLLEQNIRHSFSPHKS